MRRLLESLCIGAALGVCASLPAVANPGYAVFEDWTFIAIPGACMINTPSLSGDGTMLNHWQPGAADPKAVFFSNPAWTVPPGTWSSDGLAMMNLTFRMMSPSSVLAIRIGDKTVLADTTDGPSHFMIVSGLIVESVGTNGWVEPAMEGGPSLGRFSAKGYSDARAALDECITTLR